MKIESTNFFLLAYEKIKDISIKKLFLIIISMVLISNSPISFSEGKKCVKFTFKYDAEYYKSTPATILTRYSMTFFPCDPPNWQLPWQSSVLDPNQSITAQYWAGETITNIKANSHVAIRHQGLGTDRVLWRNDHVIEDTVVTCKGYGMKKREGSFEIDDPVGIENACTPTSPYPL